MAEKGEPLSKRELEVLQCVSQGAGNKQIAQELFISENTVKVHLRNIYRKLDAASRTEATTEAIRQGIIAVPGAEVAETAVPAPPAIEPATLTPEASSDNGQEGLQTAAAEAPIQHKRLDRRTLILVTAVILILVAGAALAGWFIANNNETIAEAEPYTLVELADNWWEGRPLPTAVAHAALAPFGLDLYLLGGETAEGITNAVWIYDTAEHTWKEGAQKPTAVADASAAELGGIIYVPGGRLPDGQPTNIVEAYSPAQDAWGSIASLPENISGGLTLSDGSSLYLVGGWEGDSVLNTVFRYDPGSSATWQQLPEMAQARMWPAGGIIAGKLYVVGGWDGKKELDSCELLDLNAANLQWESCAPMEAPRAGAGAAVLVNKLYVFGGGMDEQNKIETSEAYDPNTDQWGLVSTPVLSDAPSWTNLSVANIETRVFALGGLNDESVPTTHNFIYAPLVYQTFIPAAASGDGE
ncbi:MAG TPA: helix-turn-helix domain-containing protein [Anaerolineae bacterium]|nr:helix-turn-helix domain-containing protein [Anaerolineae bacterium]